MAEAARRRRAIYDLTRTTCIPAGGGLYRCPTHEEAQRIVDGTNS